MEYRKLTQYLHKIAQCPYFDKDSGCTCIPKFPPVINTLRPTQKYMIISSDPSGDPDKTKDLWQPHSDFEIRFLSLIFTGKDDDESVEKVKKDFQDFKKVFLKNFYWTHFNKCFADGNPNNVCAKRYLKEEVKLFDPELIIILGLKPATFLLEVKSLKDAVNKVWNYNGTKTLISLHPSRNWNLSRRPEYEFDDTWKLVRRNLEL
jgi:uracil-DNA glycosylase